MRYQLVTDDLIDEIERSTPEQQGNWLILTESSEFPGYWSVDGLDVEFFYDFNEIIGAYRIVSPVRIDEFLDHATKLRYKVAFIEDPARILDSFKALKDLPPLSLHSSLENTVNGMLPWQIIGFNKLIRSDLPAGLAIWDTGSGKTALLSSAIRWHLDQGNIDMALVVVKAHNKKDTQDKLRALADIDSIVVDGTPKQKLRIYEQIQTSLIDRPTVVIANYEKIRDDEDVFASMVDKRRVFFCWDEAPTKLGNRNTILYAAVKRMLYRSFISKPRPRWMRHLVLTATPIENDPDGLFSYLNLVRPRYLGTVAQFQADHVVRRNHFSKEPEVWTALDKIEAEIDHMTHRVSKADPDVAKMFPSIMSNPYTIDWNPKHRALYDRYLKAAEKMIDEEVEGINMMSIIQVMQMMCDAPSMILESAINRERFLQTITSGTEAKPEGSQAALNLVMSVPMEGLTDVGHTKLEAWREIIVEKHPDSKVVTHSTWASYIFPVWEYWLDRWGVSYVTFTGTDKQKQKALDAFRDDPDIRVFLSGDAGADSIDISEADVGVSYNGSWKWTVMKQREGRRDRVNSSFDTIFTYDLAMANSVEDRRRERRDLKYSYHAAIFEGKAVESALSSRMTIDDLRYLLLGDSA